MNQFDHDIVIATLIHTANQGAVDRATGELAPRDLLAATEHVGSQIFVPHGYDGFVDQRRLVSVEYDQRDRRQQRQRPWQPGPVDSPKCRQPHRLFDRRRDGNIRMSWAQYHARREDGLPDDHHVEG
jgi:hypothetical protein